MVDALDMLLRAVEEYRSRLLAVRTARQWACPTPCAEWNVRDVADHILGGNRFTILIVDGLPAERAMNTVIRGDFAGDPAQAFEVSSTAQLSALRRPGVLETMYEHPMGFLSGRQIARLRVSDLVVHAWDIARALGLPEELDHLLVMESIAVVEEFGEKSIAAGLFGSGKGGNLPENSTDQSRLLDMAGRRP